MTQIKKCHTQDGVPQFKFKEKDAHAFTLIKITYMPFWLLRERFKCKCIFKNNKKIEENILFFVGILKVTDELSSFRKSSSRMGTPPVASLGFKPPT